MVTRVPSPVFTRTPIHYIISFAYVYNVYRIRYVCMCITYNVYATCTYITYMYTYTYNQDQCICIRIRNVSVYVCIPKKNKKAHTPIGSADFFRFIPSVWRFVEQSKAGQGNAKQSRAKLWGCDFHPHILIFLSYNLKSNPNILISTFSRLKLPPKSLNIPPFTP